MKKVLLTGANGFIGRHTIPYLLKAGYQVHAVAYPTAALKGQKHRLFWHQANLLSENEQEQLLKKVKPTHLLHFDWCTTPGEYWGSLENLSWVSASLNLIRSFYQQRGKRAVLAGTCAEYDWASCGHYSESLTPAAPSTLYGTCKHSLQEMLRCFSQQSGLSSAWGRIFFVYGPHEHPQRFIPTVINSLLKNRPACCVYSNRMRDFLFVDDVARAFATLLDSPVCGAVNIGSGEPTSLGCISQLIGQLLNRSKLLRLKTARESENQPELLVADVKRLNQELGFRPKYNLEQGVVQTINWWRKQSKVKKEIK